MLLIGCIMRCFLRTVDCSLLAPVCLTLGQPWHIKPSARWMLHAIHARPQEQRHRLDEAVQWQTLHRKVQGLLCRTSHVRRISRCALQRVHCSVGIAGCSVCLCFSCLRW